tara:strand:- start:496 stop:906 length:411 start_codon:yes stop_codon:yes gene_type:complete
MEYSIQIPLNFPLELLHFIESYTRKTQSQDLLKDIIHFNKTICKIENSYTIVVHKLYNKGYSIFDWSTEFLRSLNFITNICITNYNSLRDCRQQARSIWAHKNIEDRNFIMTILIDRIKTIPISPSHNRFYYGIDL